MILSQSLRKRKRIKELTLVVLSLFLCLSSHSGCFRTALPEYYSELSSDSSGAYGRSRAAMREIGSRPFVILVTPEEDQEEEPDKTIGHQYVFGVFPLTSLYLPHGQNRAVQEVSAEILSEMGYSVLLAREQSVSALEQAFGFPYVCRVSLQSARLNAFDLFLFRSLDVSGELKLQMSGAGKATDSFIVNLDATDYRKFAYGPVLAYRFHKTLRTAVEDVLTQWQGKNRFFGSRRRGRGGVLNSAQESEEQKEIGSDSDRQLIVELRPKITSELPPLLGQQLADSWGYPNALPYTTEAIERVLQTGIRRGLPEASQGVEIWAYHDEPFLSGLRLPEATSVWLMRSEVRFVGEYNEEMKLVVDESLKLNVDVKVDEILSEKSHSLFLRSCEVEVPVDFSREGALIESFSDAAAAVSEVVFRGRTEAGRVTCKSLPVF